MRGQIWYQIEIEDIDSLSGENLSNIVSLISDYLKIQYVVVEYLDGPFGIDILKHQIPKILSLKQFDKIFKGLSQFEWGYFYLFSSKDRARYFVKQEGVINKLIPFIDAIVAVFDCMSFIIYTNNPKIVSDIKKKYKIYKFEKKKIENLEFYY